MSKMIELNDYVVELLGKYRELYEKRWGLVGLDRDARSDAELIHLAIVGEICYLEDSIRCQEKINEYENMRKEGKDERVNHDRET